MIRFFKKPGRWAAVYSLVLVATMAFVLLDTFVIPKAYAGVAEASVAKAEATPDDAAGQQAISPTEGEAAEEKGTAVTTANSYQDENISITVETLRENRTTIYVAYIWLSDPSLLKTALAGGVYGRNIKQATSDIAGDNDAVFAINGDYYGFRDTGFVVREGVLYRDTSNGGSALVIDENGTMSVVSEEDTSAQALIESGARQVLSFGPALVADGEIAVAENQEIAGKSMNSNPRTAIGQVDEGHYIAIVSDGRTDESAGLSLYQLAQEFTKRGATVAYNLDGGGSSTMVLNGEVLNVTTSGRGGGEREVSDIVYVGY